MIICVNNYSACRWQVPIEVTEKCVVLVHGVRCLEASDAAFGRAPATP